MSVAAVYAADMFVSPGSSGGGLIILGDEAEIVVSMGITGVGEVDGWSLVNSGLLKDAGSART